MSVIRPQLIASDIVGRYRGSMWRRENRRLSEFYIINNTIYYPIGSNRECNFVIDASGFEKRGAALLLIAR